MSRLQFFISSTYEDLKRERQEIIKLLLRERCIPAGMEMFLQSDRSNWEIIRDWIDESDAVILLMGNRYGTVFSETNLSFTESEYNYICQQNKPLIPLILPPGRGEQREPEQQRFVDRVKNEQGQRGEIESDTHMAQTILQRIGEIRNNKEGGNGISRYEMMQYLMFATDKENRGFNRFTVAAKVMMLQDMMREINEVEINNLNVSYEIIAGKKSGDCIYDCVRKWKMHNIKNLSDEPLSQYHFLTATDIGNREDAVIQLSQGANHIEQMLTADLNRNNGISRWIWNIDPIIESGNTLDEMVLTERVDEAWNLKRPHEIIYFVPSCFGKRIGTLSFSVTADEAVPELNMNLFMISEKNGRSRNYIGHLSCSARNGKRYYEYRVEHYAENIDMRALYYIKIEIMK